MVEWIVKPSISPDHPIEARIKSYMLRISIILKMLHLGVFHRALTTVQPPQLLVWVIMEFLVKAKEKKISSGINLCHLMTLIL